MAIKEINKTLVPLVLILLMGVILHYVLVYVHNEFLYSL